MMKTYVALFRGINVGGSGILRMKDLVGILESLPGIHEPEHVPIRGIPV